MKKIMMILIAMTPAIFATAQYSGQYGQRPWNNGHDYSDRYGNRDKCGVQTCPHGCVSKCTHGYTVQYEEAMREHDFKAFLRDVRHISFDSDRMKFVESVVHRHFFRTRQVIALANSFSFDNDRLRVAKIAFDRTVDQDRYPDVLNVFTFDSTADKLAYFLEKRGVYQQPNFVCGNDYRVDHRAISHREFEYAKNKIRRQHRANSKLNVALHVVKYNWLTARQVKELVHLMRFDEDQLKVAKAAYHKTVNREQFHIVESALRSSHDRKRLRRYIQEHRNHGYDNRGKYW